MSANLRACWTALTEVSRPLIIYVPGLLPKPEPDLHRDALLRCLLTGIGRIDPAVGNTIGTSSESFEIVPWTFDFYGRHRDFELDRPSIEALIEQPGASDRDIAEATAWTRRLTRWIYRLGDLLPFLIPHIASERMEVHLRDLRRYVGNQDGVADEVREKLRVLLLAAAGEGRPILLIGHSMGSVIAYDTLWELTHRHGNPVTVDLWLTMGSPLGQNFMQTRIMGSAAEGRERYPANVSRWLNLAAVGDLTALDRRLANDFDEMPGLGLVESIEDSPVHNWFRLDGLLNVHSEYGYLINEKTAHSIVEWWRGHGS